MKRIIYPGSFDPVTFGHLDIIKRSAKVFEEVIVGVLTNKNKQGLFTVDEKIEMLTELLYDYDNVRIKTFSGLLVDFVKMEEADGVLRGLRALSDYQYEKQMALLNSSLYPGMETIFLVANPNYSFISASYARELASFGGDVSGLVPPSVEKRLRAKFNEEE